ncbi:hypothetical protein PAPYR_3069 [Paratrimastix pyriformis]|uniref:Uncharacterized protein n=1 Tax=Paratrimastix pyriformis TaxID=342808 RepID=A0ABQ8UNQ6_9EUKA|nr:hypothetical protein PAPYR_3069 [Paratrimastix pyriformis]
MPFLPEFSRFLRHHPNSSISRGPVPAGDKSPQTTGTPLFFGYLMRLIRRLRSLDVLSIAGSYTPWSISFEQSTLNVGFLSIECVPNFGDTELFMVLRGCPQLHTLRVRECALQKPTLNHSALTTIALETPCAPQITSQSLRRLHLWAGSECELRYSCVHCPNLEQIALRLCGPERPEPFVLECSSLKEARILCGSACRVDCLQLESLAVGERNRYGSFGPDELLFALARCPRLRALRLTVGFAPALASETLVRLAVEVPWRAADSGSLAQLGGIECPALLELDLDGSCVLTEPLARQILGVSKRLRRLVVGQVDGALSCPRFEAPALAHLHLGYSALQAPRFVMPNLQTLVLGPAPQLHYGALDPSGLAGLRLLWAVRCPVWPRGLPALLELRVWDGPADPEPAQRSAAPGALAGTPAAPTGAPPGRTPKGGERHHPPQAAGSPAKPPASLAAPLQFPELRVLVLERCPTFGDRQLEAVLAGCPCLRTLYLLDCALVRPALRTMPTAPVIAPPSVVPQRHRGLTAVAFAAAGPASPQPGEEPDSAASRCAPDGLWAFEGLAIERCPRLAMVAHNGCLGPHTLHALTHYPAPAPACRPPPGHEGEGAPPPSPLSRPVPCRLAGCGPFPGLRLLRFRYGCALPNGGLQPCERWPEVTLGGAAVPFTAAEVPLDGLPDMEAWYKARAPAHSHRPHRRRGKGMWGGGGGGGGCDVAEDAPLEALALRGAAWRLFESPSFCPRAPGCTQVTREEPFSDPGGLRPRPVVPPATPLPPPEPEATLEPASPALGPSARAARLGRSPHMGPASAPLCTPGRLAPAAGDAPPALSSSPGPGRPDPLRLGGRAAECPPPPGAEGPATPPLTPTGPGPVVPFPPVLPSSPTHRRPPSAGRGRPAPPPHPPSPSGGRRSPPLAPLRGRLGDGESPQPPHSAPPATPRPSLARPRPRPGSHLAPSASGGSSGGPPESPALPGDRAEADPRRPAGGTGAPAPRLLRIEIPQPSPPLATAPRRRPASAMGSLGSSRRRPPAAGLPSPISPHRAAPPPLGGTGAPSLQALSTPGAPAPAPPPGVASARPRVRPMSACGPRRPATARPRTASGRPKADAAPSWVNPDPSLPPALYPDELPPYLMPMPPAEMEVFDGLIANRQQAAGFRAPAQLHRPVFGWRILNGPVGKGSRLRKVSTLLFWGGSRDQCLQMIGPSPPQAPRSDWPPPPDLLASFVVHIRDDHTRLTPSPCYPDRAPAHLASILLAEGFQSQPAEVLFSFALDPTAVLDPMDAHKLVLLAEVTLAGGTAPGPDGRFLTLVSPDRVLSTFRGLRRYTEDNSLEPPPTGPHPRPPGTLPETMAPISEPELRHLNILLRVRQYTDRRPITGVFRARPSSAARSPASGSTGSGSAAAATGSPGPRHTPRIIGGSPRPSSAPRLRPASATPRPGSPPRRLTPPPAAPILHVVEGWRLVGEFTPIRASLSNRSDLTLLFHGASREACLLMATEGVRGLLPKPPPAAAPKPSHPGSTRTPVPPDGPPDGREREEPKPTEDTRPREPTPGVPAAANEPTDGLTGDHDGPPKAPRGPPALPFSSDPRLVVGTRESDRWVVAAQVAVGRTKPGKGVGQLLVDDFNYVVPAFILRLG